MRVLITGSRTWTKRGPIEALMLGMKTATFVLGDNPNGVDNFARQVVNEYGLASIVCIADWNQYGKGAGHRRNSEMVSHKPDVAFAFRMEGASPGTDDCVRQCFLAGIPIYRIMPITEKTEGIITFTGVKKNKYTSEIEG